MEATVDPTQPVPRTALRGLRRQVMIFWHGVVAWALAPGWLAKLLLTALSLGLIIWPIIRLGGWKQPLSYVGVWLLVALWKAYRELSPRNMQLLQRNYLARKLMLFRLVRDMERAPLLTPPEVERFQQEALHLIATYVRDHRSDTKGMQIFANLLVEDGDDMRVVARDRTHREGSLTSAKSKTLAWIAASTGEPKITGDMYADFPETQPGKPYKSILVMPICRSGRVLGVVSIDSTRRYHFDREMKTLVDYLSPYVALLGWTIDPSWARVQPGSPLSVKGAA